jgi:16S rRNA (guanine527-N7)-methyltransferase
VNSAELTSRIARRLSTFEVRSDPNEVAAFVRYLEILSRWNGRLNLTSLPLGASFPDSTIDKLIVEPLIATRVVGGGRSSWVDIGSGNGSPAIPIRVVWGSGSLTMVESRERKSAFLREVVRQLGFARTQVVSARFEALALTDVDLVTVRAVRIDHSIEAALARCVRSEGLVLAFGAELASEEFLLDGETPLPGETRLRAYRRRAPCST